MAWSNVPDFDSASSSANDSPFASSKPQSTGRISVNLVTDDWLCKKFDRMDLTLVEGYPSKSSDAGGLQCDQFIKTARSQNKWYGVHSDKETAVYKVTFWCSEVARLNRSYSQIARSLGLQATTQASRPISHEALRK